MKKIIIIHEEKEKGEAERGEKREEYLGNKNCL